MSLNPFSIIIVGILIFQRTKKKQREYFVFVFQLTLFMYLALNVGYFIRIAGVTIDYYRFLLYFLGTLASVYNLKTKIKQRVFRNVLLLFMTIVLGYTIGLLMRYQIVSQDNGGWGAYLFGYNNEETVSFGSTQVKLILDCVFTLMILVYVRKNFSFRIWLDSFKKVAEWLKIVIIYGFLEAIFVYLFHAYSLNYKITSFFFGIAESTYEMALSRGTGFQLQGMFREPAQYARALFLSEIILFMVNMYKKSRTSFVWLLLCVGLMLLSMSFTSLLLVAVLGLLFIVYRCKENPKIQPIVLGIGAVFVSGIVAGAIILIQSGSYYGTRLQYAIDIIKTMLNLPDLTKLYESLKTFVYDGSSILRIGSSYANLRLNLPKAWLFGIGLGNSCSFSYTSNLIVDLGLIGLFFYMKLFVFWTYKNSHYIIAAIIFFGANLLTSTTQLFGVDVIMIFFAFECLFGGTERERRNKRRVVQNNEISTLSLSFTLKDL